MSVINPVVGMSIPSVSERDASLSLPAVNGSVALLHTDGVPSSVSASGAKHDQSTGASSSPSKAQVNQALEDMIKQQQPGATSVQFSIDDKLNQFVIKVVDPTTNKVIKQIPAEAVLKMREDMLAMDSKNPPAGTLLSEKT